MNSKDVKRILKEAKEAIKNKDTKTALGLCKSVLNEDRNNYVALVLFGAALQDSERYQDARNAFKKATEISPDLPLAWQGLVSYYEKHKDVMIAESEADLLKAYAHLIPLESDLVKKEEMTIKLSFLASRLQSSSECFLILANLPVEKEVANNMRRAVVKALIQIKDLTEDDFKVLKRELESIVNHWKDNAKGNDFDIQEFYRQYLKQLYRMCDYKSLVKEAKIMAETFKKDAYPLEWICKVWVEFVAEGRDISFLKDCINEVVSTLKTISPSSTAYYMAAGAINFCSSQFAIARNDLKQAVFGGQAPWHAYLLLADIQIKFGCPLEALSLLADAKTKVKTLTDSQEYVLKRCEAEALIGTNSTDNLEKALLICEEMESKKFTEPLVLLLHARACVRLKRFEEAQKYLTEIGTESLNSCASKVTLLQAEIMSLSGQRDQATFVLESIAQDAKDAEVWLALARLHGEFGKQEEVLNDLMEAARCEPFFWETFFLLGHYYKQLGSSVALDKARRCYQKALQLNPKSAEVGKSLSDVLLLLCDIQSNIQLLDMMAEANNAKWIWLRLGLLHTECGEVDKAITYLCNAARSDTSDSRVWESLGDAYMFRGAWHAALKSFQKVVQLSPGNIYAAFQIGTVKLRMEEFEGALTAFRELLMLSVNYIPALQGQGEAAFYLAQVLLQEQRLGCAHDCCQEAIDAFTKVLIQRRDLSCTWKLLGDTCLFGARMPDSYGSFHFPEWLICSSADPNGVNSTILGKTDMFLLAEKMYCRAMPVSGDNSLLWHDLACANLWHAMTVNQSTKRSEILGRALTAARRAVSLNPENSLHWNLLGVVAANEEIKLCAVSQHAFIQSIILNGNDPMPWTNLGSLYFTIGNISLANKAFSSSQRVDHEYTEGWVGQAMIAETSAHHETVDLFRHAATLKFHQESCSGYGHWVLKTLLDNENISKGHGSETNQALKDLNSMHALEMAADCMRWYTERHPADACGWNMLGLLLERLSLFRSARTALERGLEQALLVEPVRADALRCNLGRVLTDLREYELAVDTLRQVNVPTFASQTGLALALFKAKRFEEAYDTYNSALEWLAPNEETKALILVAMAAMQYGFGRLEDCQTLLFQSIQPKPLSAHPLLALCALGLLHNNMAMSKIMLKELARFKDDPRHMADLGLLQALTAFLQADEKGALRVLGKAVHRHPDCAALWLSLSHIQMHALLTSPRPRQDNVPAAARAIGRTASAALQLGRANMDVSKVQSVMGVAHLLDGDGLSALLSSQKAVHQFPTMAENWATLVASLLPEARKPERAAGLRDLIGLVRRRLQPSAAGLKKWLGTSEHYLTSLCAD